ncbi:hypothetical protein GCM10027091_62870 [Streptomyces daliensis]
MSAPRECAVEDDRHVGPVMRYLPTARYPWHEPVWLCPWHGAYLRRPERVGAWPCTAPGDWCEGPEPCA